jgi:hypothetical protein
VRVSPEKQGQLLREVALGRTSVVVSEINHARWTDDARTLSNLNQIGFHLNAGHVPEEVRPVLIQLLAEVRSLRAELRGQESSDDRNILSKARDSAGCSIICGTKPRASRSPAGMLPARVLARWPRNLRPPGRRTREKNPCLASLVVEPAQGEAV